MPIDDLLHDYYGEEAQDDPGDEYSAADEAADEWRDELRGEG